MLLTRDLSATGLLDRPVDLLKHHVVLLLLGILVLLLEGSFVTLLEQDRALSLVVEDKLVNEVVRLKAAVFPGEFCKVMRGLRVLRGQHLEVDLIPFLRCELLLVVTGHVGVVLAEEVLVVLEIILVLLSDLTARGTFLSGASTTGWHIVSKSC